ncbi:MAG: methyl-accepting chemotaxis protein [Methylococcales bacterium]|nr:methyl-accepting chemotaxis protein [Methylococcales bacterium]
MSSSSMFSNRFKINESIAFTAVGLTWSSSLAFSWMHSIDWILPACLTASSIISVAAWRSSRQANKILFDKILNVSETWRDGEVSSRITMIGGKKTDLQKIAWALNDLMDQVETAQVDMYYSMAYVTYGDFSRLSYPAGLHGSFAQALKRLNGLTKVLSETTTGINALMTALSAGDFNKQIATNVQGEFAVAINSATETMQTMKTMIANIGEVMAHVAQGNVTERIHAQGQGDFAVLKNNINLSLDALEGSLGDIVRVSNALAQGDLTQTSEKHYPGTFGEVLDGVNRTVNNLREMVRQIKDSSEVIANAAQEISAGNNDLSGRTEDQADSLEKTAANMEEFTHTVQQNSGNANQANELARISSNIARNGVIAVGQVVKTMDGINESSGKIVDIISVIDGIAFQTNILALNAAVEAARAGDQGRGFAVVATEVRSLAQRAASAAGEIKNLINDSVDKVQEGGLLVEKAGKTMEEILNSIEGVTKTISEIRSSSDEQISGIQEVNKALAQMDDVAQQNMALVEEATAAATLLEQQTRNLSETVGNFKL